jgi:hypothetical protein
VAKRMSGRSDPLHGDQIMSRESTALALTFDTDWAPPFVIQDVLNLLKGVPATFFVTDGAALRILRKAPDVELGIHPNFMPGSSHGSTRRQILQTVATLVPEARAVRSYNLVQDTTILDLYREYGLQSDLSLLEYRNPDVRPFQYWNGLVRLPYNFEDSVACTRGERQADHLWMRSASVLVCDFHPIHVYLNTDTMDRYAALRNQGALMTLKPNVLRPFVNVEAPGTRDLLLSLLQGVAEGAFVPHTVSGLMHELPVSSWTPPNRGLRLVECVSMQ